MIEIHEEASEFKSERNCKTVFKIVNTCVSDEMAKSI